jgi:spermidine synthase
MSPFEPMANVIPEGRSGDVSVEHFEMTAEEEAFTRVRALINHRPHEYCPAGRYARLLFGGAVMMSDTRMEHNTNMEAAVNARGHVLVGGLGLGMVTLPMLRKSSVASVTVVENSADVITLVEQPLRRYVGAAATRRLHVERADVHVWRPSAKGRQFDTIYFDIWQDICRDNLPEMKALLRAFARYLQPDGWAGCWSQHLLRAHR